MARKYQDRKSRGSFILCSALGAVLCLGVYTACLSNENPAPDSEHWITQAPDDAERFERLEKYLRGFDQPMWEIGERYEHIYLALKDENYELALYHWEKIKTTIENGTMKRPARRKSTEAFFLEEVWQSVHDDIASRDRNRAWEGFAMGRSACMSCHNAERVEFLNRQPLFRNTEPLRLDK